MRVGQRSLASSQKTEWVFVVALLGLLAPFVICWMASNPILEEWLNRIEWLAVKDVVIHCEPPLTVSEIKRLLPPLKGRNILSIHSIRLGEFLQSKPWVAGVTLRKQYPNRVSIFVETEKPFAILVVGGDAFYINASGKMIESLGRQMGSKELPVLSSGSYPLTGWDLVRVKDTVVGIEKTFDERVGQTVLETSPYVRVYLASSHTEITLSTSEISQLDQLQRVFQNPHLQGVPWSVINLVLPKKIIVSSSISK